MKHVDRKEERCVKHAYSVFIKPLRASRSGPASGSNISLPPSHPQSFRDTCPSSLDDHASHVDIERLFVPNGLWIVCTAWPFASRWWWKQMRRSSALAQQKSESQKSLEQGRNSSWWCQLSQRAKVRGQIQERPRPAKRRDPLALHFGTHNPRYLQLTLSLCPATLGKGVKRACDVQNGGSQFPWKLLLPSFCNQ